MSQAILKRLLWIIVRSFTITYRYTFLGPKGETRPADIYPKGAHLFCLWHEDILSVVSAHAHTRPYLAMASKSKDGDIASYVNSKFGFVPVRGSSRTPTKDKGGREALAEYIKKVGEGECGGISVDGPKGPRRVCKPGIVIIAQKTGAPIFPGIGRAKNPWVFNSWDRFKVPKFFSKIKVVIGEPIFVPSDATTEQIDSYCRLIEKAMADLEARI